MVIRLSSIIENMDGCASEIVATAGAILIPVALHTAKSCMTRVRDPRKIQKSVLCLPHRCGKTHLHDALIHQHQVLVCDVDEQIKAVCDEKKVEKLMATPLGTFEFEMSYDECADMVLALMKERIKHHKGLKVLFVTSSLTWAKSFKSDAVYIASPDAEFWDKIVNTEPLESKREELRRARQRFISQVPAKGAIVTYNNFKELTNAVKQRLGITQEL